jgi:hypothetical protein
MGIESLADPVSGDDQIIIALRQARPERPQERPVLVDLAKQVEAAR